MSDCLKNTNARSVLAAFALFLVSATGLSAVVEEQSPIDITGTNTTYTTLPSLDFSYGVASLTMTGNGLTGEELNVKADASGVISSLTLSGTSYSLLQFHFHTQAEHLINGVRPEMELHIVHRNSVSNQYLVVGLLIEIDAVNTALSPFFDNLPTEASIGSFSHSIPSFDLNNLLPTSTASFRYTGSLTTTPYTEGVNWVVMNERLTISQGQLDAFRELFPEGNSRAVQDLNGRVISTDVVGFAAIPEPSTYAALAGALALAVCGIRRRLDRN